MRDSELLSQIQREALREVVAELLDERQSIEAARQRAQQQSEAEALASIRRKDLTPKQISELVNRLGKDGYLALPYDDERPRGANGRFRPR